VQGLSVGTSHYPKADVAVPLHGTYHDSLVALVAASLAFHLATDKGFVYFDYAAQELHVYLVERGAYAVRQVPSGFVGHAQGTLELISGNALLGFYDEVDCQKPLPEWKVRIMKDGVSSNGELVAA